MPKPLWSGGVDPEALADLSRLRASRKETEQIIAHLQKLRTQENPGALVLFDPRHVFMTQVGRFQIHFVLNRSARVIRVIEIMLRP